MDSTGDNLLAEFASAVDAVQSAVAIQQDLATQNASLPEHRQMHFRIGVNLGDVLIDGERLYGDGVNIVARLESLAEGGGICISGTIYDQVETKLTVGYSSLGEHRVKNITKPVRVYQVLLDPAVAGMTIQAASAMAPEDRPVVCFIDDDPQELAVFRRAFGQDLQIVTATRWSQALAELEALGKRPNLFILDLYFPTGRESTDSERAQMVQLKADVDAAQKRLSDYLASIGQDREGGLQLLAQVRDAYREAPTVFYTRKGTLDDANACLDAGAAAVLRKPQPDALEPDANLREQLEAATLAQRTVLLNRFEALGSSTSLLRKVVRAVRYVRKNWGNF